MTDYVAIFFKLGHIQSQGQGSHVGLHCSKLCERVLETRPIAPDL